MKLKKLSRKIKPLSHFMWLIILILIAGSVTYFYDINKKEQSQILRKTFNNIYLGLNLRLNRLLSNSSPNNFTNLYIPGFNKVTDDNSWGSGFNYTLTYSLPLKFNKKAPIK